MLRCLLALAATASTVVASPPPSPSPTPGGPTLAVVQATRDGARLCRVEPISGRMEVVVTVPPGTRFRGVAWDATAERVLIWLVVPGVASDRLWIVDPRRGARVGMAGPPLGRLAEVGFDAAGTLLAIASEEALTAKTGLATALAGDKLTFRGRSYPLEGQGGTPRLVHLFRRTGQAWELAGTRAIRDGGANPGFAKRFLARTKRPSWGWLTRGGWPVGAPLAPVVGPLLPSLARLRPSLPGAGRWVTIGQGEPAVVGWQEGAASAAGSVCRPIAVARDGQVGVAPGLAVDDDSAFDLLRVVRRGPYVLVTGDGCRLVDARDGRLVYEMAGDGTATFWPEPGQNMLE